MNIGTLKYTELELINIKFTNIVKMLIARNVVEDTLDNVLKIVNSDIKKSLQDSSIYIKSELKINNKNINIVILQRAAPASIIIKDFSITDNDKKNYYIFITTEPKNLKTLYNYTNIEIFDNNFFDICLYEHELVPKHVLCTSDEKEEILGTDGLDCLIDNLPKMCIDDPNVKYFNAKENDIFKIYRYTELSGMSIVYRAVKNYKSGTESSR